MSNRDYAYSWLVSHGYPAAAAAGIVGNLVQESGVNPVVRPGDNGTAHGIAQWRGDRYAGLQNYAQQHGGSLMDLNTQLGFLDHELRSKYGSTYGRLMSARTPGDAAGAFALGYERPRGAETGIASNVDGWGNRLSAANAVFSGMPTPTGSAPRSMAAAFMPPLPPPPMDMPQQQPSLANVFQQPAAPEPAPQYQDPMTDYASAIDYMPSARARPLQMVQQRAMEFRQPEEDLASVFG